MRIEDETSFVIKRTYSQFGFTEYDKYLRIRTFLFSSTLDEYLSDYIELKESNKLKL